MSRRLASLFPLQKFKSFGPAKILADFIHEPSPAIVRDDILRHRQYLNQKAHAAQSGVFYLHQRNCQLFDLATSARTALQNASDVCQQSIAQESLNAFRPNFLALSESSTSEAQLLLQTAAHKLIEYKNALHVSNQNTSLLKKEWQLKGVNLDVDPLFSPVLGSVPAVFFGEEIVPQVEKLRHAQDHCQVLINKLHKHQNVLQQRLEDTSHHLSQSSQHVSKESI